MKATLVLPGRWMVSKQNSYLARPHGGKYKNPRYAAEQDRMLKTIVPQLREQMWRCTRKRVALKITFYGRSMPVDWDNCGLLTDTLQGPSEVIHGKRYRAPGPVVWDDRQFVPVTVSWRKATKSNIVIDLIEICESNEEGRLL